MSSAVKRKLSESVDGLGITVAATGTAGTLIHTATASTTDGTYDEIYLWAYNSDSANVTIFIEWGTATLPRKVIIPLQAGLVPIVPGLPLQNGKEVRVYCASANKVVIDGFVNHMTD